MSLLNLIDLTSLNTTDNKSHIIHFTGKVNSFSGRFSNIPNVAAICVFPNFVAVVKEKLTARNVKIAVCCRRFSYLADIQKYKGHRMQRWPLRPEPTKLI